MPRPILTLSSTITLDYPPTSPTDTVTLPAPIFDNVQEVSTKRVLRKTRGLTQKAFINPTKAKIETFNVTIQNVATADKDLFLALVVAAYGKLIRYTDYESQIWDGTIRPDSVDIVEQVRDCGWVITFVFEI